MAQSFLNHPFLTGIHTPNRFETDAPDLAIEGEFPEDLEGVFYRTGAEAQYPPLEGQDYHWFDGDGMVYRFFIQGGRVSMRNRWVQTEKFKAERKAGRKLYGLFGNPMTSDPSVKGIRYNTANTNIILHEGKLWALMEGAPPVHMEADSLDTIGEYHYGGIINTTFSAHPTLDYSTGELLNFGCMMHGQGGPKTVRYDVISKDGKLKTTEFFEAPHRALQHTFLVTENWVVFPCEPLDVSLERAMKGGPMVAWIPERPMKLGLMPRSGDTSKLRWLEMPARHMFHELNAWEEEDKLIMDVAAANGTALFPNEQGEFMAHLETTQSLRRWTIDLSGKTNEIKEEILNGRDIQFPRPDDRRITRKTQNCFANINLKSTDGRAMGMDSAFRYNTHTGEEDIYNFGEHANVGEVIFAPRKGSTDEADGYALTMVREANDATTYLVVFDAKNISAGPLGKAVIPFRVPPGFHCNYYPSDGDLYKSTFG